MTVEADPSRGDAFYNEFYQDGGWKYSYFKEYRWHRRNVVKRFHLKKGSRLLEVGCGNGFHTDLFRRMGFDAIGLDRSETGIAWAKTHHPRSTYHCCDLEDAPVQPGSFDIALARGLSSYHYNLMGEKAIDSTAGIMRFLKPGGLFVMVIITDLSGSREPNQVWQNRLNEYERHFALFGDQWSVDWVKGMAVCGLYNTGRKTGVDASTPAVSEPALVS